MADKDQNKNGQMIANVPTQFLAAVIVPVDDEEKSDESVKKAYEKVFRALDEADGRQILFEFGVKLTEYLNKNDVEATIVFVPGILTPLEDKELADVVDKFMKQLLEAADTGTKLTEVKGDA